MVKMHCILLVEFVLCGAINAVWGDSQDKIILQGKIIARQQIEQMPQVGSFVENEDHFLFKANSNNPILIKLVHKYYGYSELDDDMLLSTPILQIYVKEEYSCGETYEEFIKNASIYSLKWSELFEKQIDPLKVYDKHEIQDINNKIYLKCYILKQKDYKLISKNHGHP
jgi:hypothetical protein